MELKDGIVKLSGFCEATFELYGQMVDGFIIQINGINYGACLDPDDGYRSYGEFFETNQPCTNTFPPQDVLLEVTNHAGGSGAYGLYDDPRMDYIEISNPETKKTILEVGTIWYDSYYPMGRCYFNPEALPINKLKQLNYEKR
jgi:hypothetical protein